MNKQIYFEDVTAGQELSPLEKQITTINITMYCAINWLMDRIHYDHAFATKERGLPSVVEPGNMGLDYYCQLLENWAGNEGAIRKIAVQYRDFRVPGDTIRCGGKITRKYEDQQKGYVELELWMIKQNGVNCAPGTAVVELPMKGNNENG